jgi:cytochrome c
LKLRDNRLYRAEKAKETAMDSFELNKIIGAILGTLLFVMGIGFAAEAIYAPKAAAPGFTLPVPEGSEHGAEPEAPAAAVPIGVLLASADAAAGESAIKKCQSCHNFAAGAGNKTGPELYDVVERVIGSHPGFAYSAAMEEHKAKGDTWTYDNLNAFLLAPKDFVPETKMNFSGLKNDAERANVIAYLASLSASPKPFPPAEAAPAAAPAEGAAAPAEGAAPMATDANATATPTTTSSETAVEGTPTTSGTEGAAPAATTEPAAPAAH